MIGAPVQEEAQAMSSAAAKTRCTPQEYLVFERKSPIKHEYRDGLIFEIPRSNRWHNLIAGNLFGEVSRQLRDRPCEVYAVNMRVLVRRTGLYTYPDVAAVCGEPRFEDSAVDTLLNPNMIVEVLSDSTEAYDRGKKFGHYRRLESLREYVLVAQDEMRVERYIRQGDDWLLTELSSLDDTLHLESIGCAVAVREIYAKVELAGG
jgi:Uma2 family endonuclease